MICPNCAHENPDDAKFCNNCGHKLAGPCPNCGHENPPGSKFCNNCGHKLAAAEQTKVMPAAPAGTGDVQALMPQTLAAKLQSARASGAMAGERRIVTMLFCDIKGSTAAAEHLDPEEWAEVMNEAFAHMIAPVYRYEGTVARLMGDAILAFFGAPLAHEDDPQRAVLAGLEIVSGIEPFKEKIAAEWGIGIDVRVGINTGLVMVGQVGSDLQMEYTALGDAINVAARMEQTAEPGTVQISAETYKSITPLFEFEDLGEVAVKGKSDAMHTYRPLRLKQRAGRLRGIEGMDSPLVGRSAELRALRAALDNLGQGIGGVVFLIGEAGLGKSRLIAEIAPGKNGDGEGNGRFAWYETASLSYEMQQPYAIFQRLLRRMWGIAPNDAAETIREKIRAGQAGSSDEQEIFEILLGVGSKEESAADGENFKRDLYKAMTGLWERQAAEGPVAVVLDDLHWADPASVELLEHLLKLIDHLPLLLFCILRADRGAPGWEIKSLVETLYPHRLKVIALRALGDEETNALVDNLLTISDLTPQLRARILEKADGNPFFVEEVVRMLVDRGVVVKETIGDSVHWRTAGEFSEADIPDNLQSLLIARIDRLDEEAKRTLQLASVIGRSFYYRVLEAIRDTAADDTADPHEELITLQRKELIRQAARLPEPEYLFRHALTQEAAYSTILLRERRTFHRRVGEAIEALFAERLEEFYPVLANHFGEARDPRALRYETLAGDAAFRLYAIPQALAHYTHALQLARLDGSLATDRSPEAGLESLKLDAVTHLFLRRGRCLELQSDYGAAQENYAEMETAAREQENQEMLLAAIVAQATAFAIPSAAQDAEKGQVLADEGLAMARDSGNEEAEAKLLWICMLLKVFSGLMPEGVPFGERSVELARRLGMREQLAFSLQDLAMTKMSVGLLQEADGILKEAAPLWEALNNLPMLAENLADVSFIHVMTGAFDEALAAAEKALRISQSIENERGQVNAYIFASMVYVARGEIDLALERTEDLIRKAEATGHPGNVLGWFYLGLIYSHLGAFDRAAHAAGEGLKASPDFVPFYPISLTMAARERIHEGDFEAAEKMLAEAKEMGEGRTIQALTLQMNIATAEYFLARRDYRQAGDTLAALLDEMRRSGSRYFLPDALRLQADLRREEGRFTEARESLQAARAAAEAIGANIVLWQILAELGETDSAREIVDSIAGTISDEALRETFLVFAESKLDRKANRRHYTEGT